MPVRITYQNKIQNGSLTGEIVSQKDGYIYLKQFFDEEHVIAIKEKYIKSIDIL